MLDRTTRLRHVSETCLGTVSTKIFVIRPNLYGESFLAPVAVQNAGCGGDDSVRSLQLVPNHRLRVLPTTDHHLIHVAQSVHLVKRCIDNCPTTCSKRKGVRGKREPLEKHEVREPSWN